MAFGTRATAHSKSRLSQGHHIVPSLCTVGLSRGKQKNQAPDRPTKGKKGKRHTEPTNLAPDGTVAGGKVLFCRHTLKSVMQNRTLLPATVHLKERKIDSVVDPENKSTQKKIHKHDYSSSRSIAFAEEVPARGSGSASGSARGGSSP